MKNIPGSWFPEPALIRLANNEVYEVPEALGRQFFNMEQICRALVDVEGDMIDQQTFARMRDMARETLEPGSSSGSSRG